MDIQNFHIFPQSENCTKIQNTSGPKHFGTEMFNLGSVSGDDHDKEHGDFHLKSKEGGLRTVWGQPGLHSKSEAS